MEKPKRKQVRHSTIVEYWSDKVDETELNVDWSDALTHCWGCGYERKLQGAHIVPHCLGGESVATNMVLLCTKCNRENPHSNSVEDFWNWIKSKRLLNRGGSYNTSRGVEVFNKYKEIYNKSLATELFEIFNNDMSRFYEELKKFTDENKGKYYMNNISTEVVFYNNFIAHMKNKFLAAE